MRAAYYIAGAVALAVIFAPSERMPWPVVGRITSPFQDPERGGDHNGTDIAVPVGTPVLAPDDGVVVATWYDNEYGGGNSMRVKLANGLLAGFAHLSAFVLGVGDVFARRDVLALTGNTGHSTGPHLHYTLRRDGVYVDPETLSA